MRKLRGLGLDTAILREGAPSRELVDNAEDEDRNEKRSFTVSASAAALDRLYDSHDGNRNQRNVQSCSLDKYDAILVCLPC